MDTLIFMKESDSPYRSSPPSPLPPKKYNIYISVHQKIQDWFILEAQSMNLPLIY